MFYEGIIMIDLENINVTFSVKHKKVEAVKNVTLQIEKGEFFGIVGTSGAGKSTLVRTINLLEKPTSGRVKISGVDITDYKGEELRNIRLDIGMIFQHFNLIYSKTVYENIAYALKVGGKNKNEIEPKVDELLSLVGLEDKKHSYPGKLSGGQKQRVGIARAIANNPEILLCDEPTSALDLETTNSILELLKNINKKLGITTVLISHEMSVIKQVCDRVAVMDEGKVVELNDAYSIFANPKSDFTKQLIAYTLNLNLPEKLLENTKGVLLKVVYRGSDAIDPVISDTVKKFDIDVNILHGKIEYIGGRAIGILLINIFGERKEEAVDFLKSKVAELEVIKNA
jgi:D-methionine transport system ATP-binding protein